MSDGDFGGGAGAQPPSEPMGIPPKPAAGASARDRIIEALMELAAEREWEDFSLSDVAERAGVSLADFRDAFPSKGAVLAALSKKIDRIVLEGTTTDLRDEGPKERLFDVLMRRLDAMTPYKLGLESVAAWARRDMAAAAALNGVAINAMRFMLEAAGIDTERRAGTLKIQGLVLAWVRVMDVWFKDDDATLSRTMAVLDRELKRGETLTARVDDLDRLVSPLRIMAQSLMNAGERLRDRDGGGSSRKRRPDVADSDPSI